MAKHTLMVPDFMVGRELRSIVWDDEAGTVEGEHSQIDDLREDLAKPTPYVVHNIAASWTLDDPAHDPADFLALIGFVDWRVLEDPLRSTLPPVFDGVGQGTLGVLKPCPPGCVQ